MLHPPFLQTPRKGLGAPSVDCLVVLSAYRFQLENNTAVLAWRQEHVSAAGRTDRSVPRTTSRDDNGLAGNRELKMPVGVREDFNERTRVLGVMD